jgi:hypothetical protein
MEPDQYLPHCDGQCTGLCELVSLIIFTIQRKTIEMLALQNCSSKIKGKHIKYYATVIFNHFCVYLDFLPIFVFSLASFQFFQGWRLLCSIFAVNTALIL